MSWNLLIVLVRSRAPSEYLVAYHGHGDTHQRAEDIEEAIWQICDGRHAQDGSLCHAAAAPRIERRGDSRRVLHRTSQQAALISAFRINVLVDVGREDDGKILVRNHAVQDDACSDSRSHPPLKSKKGTCEM